VCQEHSTRAAQIDAVVGPDASPHARGVAARATRDRKAHEDVGDLMARWQAELTALGHPPAVLATAVDAAGAGYRPPVVDLPMLAGELLAPGGRLAGEKTSTRADVIVAVAPYLHGLPVPVLDAAVDAVLAHPDAVRLRAVTGASTCSSSPARDTFRLRVGRPVGSAAKVCRDRLPTPSVTQ
jgi:hypothetical protein